MKVELAELVLIIIVFFIIIVVIIVVVVVVVVVVVRYASATFTRSSPHRAACNSLVSQGGCSNWSRTDRITIRSSSTVTTSLIVISVRIFTEEGKTELHEPSLLCVSLKLTSLLILVTKNVFFQISEKTLTVELLLKKKTRKFISKIMFLFVT